MQDQPFRTEMFYHHVALFEKAGEFAAIALTRTSDGLPVLGRHNRHGVTHSAQTEGFAEAKKNFENSIQQSVDAGWSVAWRGFPFGRRRTFCVPCGGKEWGARAIYCGECGGKLDG